MTKLIPVSALLLLGACVKFGNEPPPSLLALDSNADPAVGQTRSSAEHPTIAIAVPEVPKELSVQRVPVRSTDTSLAYVKNAQWVEPPANLFARLLSDTVTARTGHVVLGSAQSAIAPGAQLSGELRNFGVDATTSEAVVIYDAALRRGDAQTLEARRFEARVPVSMIAAQPVGRALNQAANEVAVEVADWVGR